MVLLIEKFLSLVLSRNAIVMLHHTVIIKSNFSSNICQVAAYGGLKTKENFKFLDHTVYDLMKGGHLQEVPNILI